MFNQLLILLTLIIIITISINGKESYTNIENNDTWKDYRLGDVFKLYINRRSLKTIISSVNMLKRQPRKFPGSLAGDYIKFNRNESTEDYDLLMKLIEDKKHLLPEMPQEKNAVLHLRIGDAIEDYKNKTFKYYFAHKKIWATPIKKIKRAIPLLKQFNKIVVMFGSHKNLDPVKKRANEIYIKKIKHLFKKNKINYQFKGSNNPDLDFMYMSYAPVFIKSNGGYSEIISKIVKKRGNKVINILK